MPVSPPLDLLRARFARLPLDERDVWQLDVVRMPQWVHEGDSRPFRPWAAVVRSVDTGLIGAGPSHRQAPDGETGAIAALASLATERDVRVRPAVVELRDRALYESLEPELRALGITPRLASSLPHLDESLEWLRRRALEAGPPGMLEGAGVTREGVRAFAEAAAEFLRAAPWLNLSDLDPIVVEAPAPGPGLGCAVVMGRIRPALAFFDSRAEFENFADEADGHAPSRDVSQWAVDFEPEENLPIADADLWEADDLPLGAPDAFPLVWRAGGREPVQRPSADVLAWIEGLLRALAASTTEDLDTGRWRRRVATAAGEREYVLALPDVLDAELRTEMPPDRRAVARMSDDVERAIAAGELGSEEELEAFLEKHRTAVEATAARRPSELADDFAFEADRYEGVLAQKLARRAIALDPDQPEAWIVLAREMPDPERACELWRRAIAGAERRLGDVPARLAGSPTLQPDDRAWIDARAGLAETLFDLDRDEEAFAEWRVLLRADPDDHDGARWLFVPRLLETGRDAEAGEWLERYEDDRTTMMQFCRALLALRRFGAGPAAEDALAGAWRANRRVIKHLLADTVAEVVGDGDCERGSEEEAALVAAELGLAFEETAGAHAWLRDWRRRRKKELESARRRR